MNTVGYIIEVLISSGLFLALYRWLLAGKVRYRICRAYIVGTMLLAAVIPLLDVPMYSPAPVPAAVERALVLVPEAMPESGIVPGEGAADEIPAAPAATEAIVLKILAAAYILISASSIALIVFNTIKIRRLRREAASPASRTGPLPRARRSRPRSHSCGRYTWASTTVPPSAG